MPSLSCMLWRTRTFALVVFSVFAASAALAVPSGLSAHTSASDTGPLVHLPSDQAAHTGAANEWWYVVGHLRSGSRTFGYEVTIFHINHLRPSGFSAPLDLYRTDIAITDERGHRFYHEITPYFPQSASVSTTSLDVRVGHTSLAGSSPAHMVLRGIMPDGSIHLNLSSRRVPLLVGGRGYLPFGAGYTYYYSLTDLATTGTIRLGSKTYSATGLSWLDHQWGDWAWATVGGWTWTCLQLDNGLQLSAFDFHGDKRRVQGANLLWSNGRFQLATDVRFVPVGTWRSPHTGGNYPAAVMLQAPSLRLNVRIQPVIADQEMVWTQYKRGSYWEGSSRVSGTLAGKRIAGEAYLELTGFARG